MFMYTDNPSRDYDRHCAEQEAWRAKCPVCDGCGEVITDDYYYEITGEIYCEDCMNDCCRKSTDDYIESQND